MGEILNLLRHKKNNEESATLIEMEISYTVYIVSPRASAGFEEVSNKNFRDRE